MAIDTMTKRMSALNVACPWRGPLTFGVVSFSQGNRQAADFMFSGILAAGVAGRVHRAGSLNGLGGVGQQAFNPNLAGI